MSLIARAIDRGKRTIRAAADLQRRGLQRSRARPPRPTDAIDEMSIGSALVVVAHPDDDVIAAGALLSRVPRAGVICVSDGAPRNAAYSERAGFPSRFDYSVARRREAEVALGLIGRELNPLTNLRIVDQEIVFELAALTRYLVAHLRSGYSHIVTHAYEGGHPDHDSVAFAVHAACALIHRSGEEPPPVLEAPLYTGAGNRRMLQTFIDHTDAGPAFRLQLSPRDRDLKKRMLAEHVSQGHLLGEFQVESELFRRAPRYHFSLPPHRGKVGFDAFRWPTTSRKWRWLAWQAMRELGLLDELA
jgi:LmbE family N-acetylglucosaminyl deacetylase